MLSKYVEKIKNTYNEQGYFDQLGKLDEKDLFIRMYMFYQYFNADDTKLDEIEETIIKNKYIDAMYESELEEDHFDFIKVLNNINQVTLGTINDTLKITDDYFVELFNGTKGDDFDDLRSKFIDLGIDENKVINVILLAKKSLDSDSKSIIRAHVTNYNSRIETLNFVIFFPEDILEFIDDIESPSLFVKKGEFLLTDNNQFLFHGEEKSVITSISAKSLKDIYTKHGTKGLFSSNLRYYVKSAKIDMNIKNSIINEPEKFWYFNNGLIITCENYVIKDNKIELTNFSIVNGGQTTNLIGNTVFETDFSVICKIIKNKYEDKRSNSIFLGKVAETSNTQKPIKTRDLISNRIEQKNLQEQFNDIGIFLEVKRGQKINKELYPERWQNAKNDEVGQMLFSFMYQHPGIARNSKSKMLENEAYYDIIFRSQYNSVLLLSLQHYKVGYNKWLTKTKKTSTDNNKVGLSKYSIYMFLAIIGFIAKLHYNEELRNKVFQSNSNDVFTNEYYKNIISQNDIGKLPIFRVPEVLSELKEIEEILDILYEAILLPAYKEFRTNNPNIAYANYTKNDTNHYRSIIPVIVKKYKENWANDPLVKNIINKHFDDSQDYIIELKETTQVFGEYKPGLSEELTEYRTIKYREGGFKIKAYDIFTNNQRSKIVHFKPKTLDDLIKDCGMKDFSIRKYGEDILKIVEKYIIR